MEKILVIQTAFIGDAILTLPMIQKLKEIFPAAIIDVVAIPSTREIFAASPSVSEVLILDKRGEHKPVGKFLRFARTIKNKRYSRIYSPHRSFRSSLLVFLSGVKETYGFDRNSFKQAYRHHAKYEEKFHEVQRNFSLIGSDNLQDDWRILPIINVPAGYKNKVEKFFGKFQISDKFVALAPGSVWNTKKYPAEYYSDAAAYLVSLGFIVLLIGGNSDIEECNIIAANKNDNVISLAGMFNLLESIELLKRCSLLICNDSAPTHLGMCADIPVLTLYCSTIADFGFYPYNSKSSYLSYNDLYCKPCGIHGYMQCPIKTFECGYNLKPLLVNAKIKEMLNGN